MSERCDGLAALPMRGPVESLNVSVAAAVFLYEVRRQRDEAGGGPQTSAPPAALRPHHGPPAGDVR